MTNSNNGTEGTDSTTVSSVVDEFADSPIEVHAIVIGLALGLLAGGAGNLAGILQFILGGAAGSRTQRGLGNYLQQAKTEAPYAAAGAIIGYFAAKYLL